MTTPHKHAELIKAWADGATIEYRVMVGEGLSRWSKWFVADPPNWSNDYDTEYRIKPESKPDKILYAIVGEYQEHHYHYEGFTQITDGFNKENFGKAKPNLKLTFDGETGEPKLAEVLK